MQHRTKRKMLTNRCFDFLLLGLIKIPKDSIQNFGDRNLLRKVKFKDETNKTFDSKFLPESSLFVCTKETQKIEKALQQFLSSFDVSNN